MTQSGHNSQNHAYRPDVDGLRALAVLAVVYYHAFPVKLKGGFVGVDIFFVISGFLISTIIIREFESHRFSYINFMARRVRRIIPSLMLVVFCTLGAGWILLLDREFMALAKQSIFGSLFSANILFWSETGYFDAASELKPLLHLWSLGIEEQFYIVWPAILYLSFKMRLSLIKVSIALLGISLGICLWQTTKSPSAAFYLLPSRFWELMAGALLALINLKYKEQILNLSHRTLNFTSFLGFLLMMSGIIWTEKESFPGAWPLLPVLGASLFIFSGPKAILNRFVFSSRPAVYIGLLSYPLYLWHWPMISFTYILSGGAPLNHHLVIGLVISFILAALTTHFLESRTKALSVKKAYGFCVPLLVLASALGGIILFRDGFQGRFANQFKNNQGDIGHEDFHTYADTNFFPCADKVLLEHSNKFGSHQRCHQSKQNTNLQVAILGDSHAEHLFFGLTDIMPDENVIYLIQVGLPFLDNPDFDYIFSFLLNSKSIRTVVLTANWYGHHKDALYEPKKLERTVAALTKAGKHVILTDDVHSFTFDPSICLTKRRLQLRPNQCTETNPNWKSHRDSLIPLLTDISKRYGSTLILTSEMLRDDKGYLMAKDGQLLYRDSHHLNITGSKLVGSLIKKSGQWNP